MGKNTPPQFRFRSFLPDVPPEKWWNQMKLGDYNPPIVVGTSTVGHTLYGTTTTGTFVGDPEDWPWNKPKRPAREPRHRFLKNRDIDKLMEKHFGKENRS